MNKCLKVAEIGINHNGDINLAKQLIDIAILGGCEFVKFQKRNIDLCYTKEELDKERKSPWGSTNRDQKNGLEFGKKEYDEIDSYCREKGIQWYASPWDIVSVDFLMQYNIPFIKIASASNTDIELLYKIKETRKDVIISTGMSSQEEIDRVLTILDDQVKYILSCTSIYPSKPKEMNMNRIITLKELYGHKYKIGFSNHSPGICFILQAVIMGCEMVEYHITKDRSIYGSDQAASIEKGGILKIKEYINAINSGWGNGKIECLKSEIPIKNKLRKECK